MQITITLTDHQYKCFTYSEINPEFLFNSMALGRANMAETEIVNLTVQKLLELGEQIPSTKEAIVDLAFERGYVMTAKDRTKVIETV
jgi:reverse gyrase